MDHLARTGGVEELQASISFLAALVLPRLLFYRFSYYILHCLSLPIDKSYFLGKRIGCWKGPSFIEWKTHWHVIQSSDRRCFCCWSYCQAWAGGHLWSDQGCYQVSELSYLFNVFFYSCLDFYIRVHVVSAGLESGCIWLLVLNLTIKKSYWNHLFEEKKKSITSVVCPLVLYSVFVFLLVKNYATKWLWNHLFSVIACFLVSIAVILFFWWLKSNAAEWLWNHLFFAVCWFSVIILEHIYIYIYVKSY